MQYHLKHELEEYYINNKEIFQKKKNDKQSQQYNLIFNILEIAKVIFKDVTVKIKKITLTKSKDFYKKNVVQTRETLKYD